MATFSSRASAVSGATCSSFLTSQSDRNRLKLPDGQGLVHVVARAGLLAGMVAHASANAGKRVLLAKQIQGFSVLALVDQGDVALDAHMSGARGLARGSAALFNGKGAGHALGIELVGRLTVAKALVEQVRRLYGADLGALAAGRALVQIHVARALSQFDLEVTGLARNPLHLGQGVEVDVQVPPGFDQLGRYDAHGAVVGGKRLVELGHHAADGRLLLDHMHQIARVGHIQGRLNARDSSSDHHYGTDYILGHRNISLKIFIARWFIADWRKGCPLEWGTLQLHFSNHSR